MKGSVLFWLLALVIEQDMPGLVRALACLEQGWQKCVGEVDHGGRPEAQDSALTMMGPSLREEE